MKCNSINLFFCSCTLFFLLSASCENENPDIPDSPLNGRTTAVFNPDKKYGSVTDVEGNFYKTIKIGNQVWMAKINQTPETLSIPLLNRKG